MARSAPRCARLRARPRRPCRPGAAGAAGRPPARPRAPPAPARRPPGGRARPGRGPARRWTAWPPRRRPAAPTGTERRRRTSATAPRRRARPLRDPGPRSSTSSARRAYWRAMSARPRRAERLLERHRATPEGFGRAYGAVSPGAPRFAGAVLSDCDAPDVPWHRIVRADGSLAKGARQRALLEAEGVPFVGERVDMRAARLHD